MSRSPFSNNRGFLSIAVVIVAAIAAIYLSWMIRSVRLHSEFISILTTRNQLLALRESTEEYIEVYWTSISKENTVFENRQNQQLEPIHVINENSEGKCYFAAYSDGIWIQVKMGEKVTDFRLNYTQENDRLIVTTIQFLEE